MYQSLYLLPKSVLNSLSSPDTTLEHYNTGQSIVFLITLYSSYHKWPAEKPFSVGPHNAFYTGVTREKTRTRIDLPHTVRVLRVQKCIS